MRSLESFHHHLETTVANCHTSWIVLKRNTLLGDEYIITPHLCKSNYCDVCRPKNLINLRKVLYDSLGHRRWRLVTLTFPDHSADLLTTLRTMNLQFKRFIQRIKRVHQNLAFVRAVEIHQSGFPHIHMIIDNYIPIAFLQKHWHDVGGGFVKINSKKRGEKKTYTYSYRDAAHYLTDELEKKVQDPHRLGHIFWQASCRSITTSRNLKLKKLETEWRFYDHARTLKDAFFSYELDKDTAEFKNLPVPQIHYGKNSYRVGFGFTGG